MSDMNTNTETMLEKLNARITELEDREAIRSVLNEFSNTADTKDMTAQGLLFTEDAKVFQHFGENINVLDGREGIVKAFGDYLATVALTYHFNGQQEIKFKDPEHAVAASYCKVVQILERDGKKYMLDGGAHYVDQFVKKNGEWKIEIRDQYPNFQENKEITTEVMY